MSNQISKEIEKTLHSLRVRGINAIYAENREAARKLIVDMVPENSIIGCGDSTTVRSTGVLQDLDDLGNRVLNPFRRPKIMRERPKKWPLSLIKHTVQGCDVFISSSNAVTQDGKLVNIDGGGARVTGMVFGPHLSIVLVGRNKIVKNVDEALYRIKNVIAPRHAKTIKWNCPCVDTGQCVEPENVCDPDRSICNITVILERRPAGTELEIAVIIVDEDLGLSWDPAWSQERIDRIVGEYEEFTPPHFPRDGS